MADQSQQTEKPTTRRLEKARREGQFPVSRELVSAVQFTATVAMAGWYGHDALTGLQALARRIITEAFTTDVTPAECYRLYRLIGSHVFGPVLAAGAAVMSTALAAHLAVTRLAVAPKNLAPKISRLNPMSRLKELKSQNLAHFFQAVVLLPLFGYAAWVVVRSNLPMLSRLPFESLAASVREIGRAFDDFLWKAAGAILLWGLIDLTRQQRRFNQQMRMSKQEIRDETKEAEGNPQMKQRIRRIQRDLLRRKMMSEVPTATAVVVNPTHYAVAIRYSLEAMAAPRVVAKGKNYLALRIRQKAIEHMVPIVENPPLAQALYTSAEVGQEIPPALYRAVAEILAYIFKIQARR